MGFIASYVKSHEHQPLDGVLPRSPTDRGRGRQIWQQLFNQTNKEETHEKRPIRPVPGGSYGRSFANADTSTMRLLQAMRSMAPGGWSDDRYEQTKRYVGATYVSVFRLCMRLQQAEFQIFHKDPRHPDGKRPVLDSETTEERNGPYDLVKLLQRPNKQDSFGKFMFRLAQQKFLTGTALNWMVPNKLGTPIELYAVPTAIAIPQPAVNPDYPDGYYRIQPIYPYGPFSSYPTPTSAVGAAIPAQWITRFQYPHPLLRYEGYSPQTGMRLQMDELEMMDRSRHYKMRRGSNPDAVVNFEDMEGGEPLPGPEIDRIKAEWENDFQGPENHGRLIVGMPGAKIEPWAGPSPREMDYGQSWEQLLSFILGGFGITKPAAGMVDDASYSTLYATIRQLNLITLDPECDDFANELTHHLAPFYGDDLIIEIRCKRIDDHDINFMKIDKGIAAKVLKKNDVLKLLDLPTTQESWGSEFAGEGNGPLPQQQGGMMQQQEQGSGPGESDPSGTGADQGTGAETDGMSDELEELYGDEDQEIENTRPRPGKLSEGSLGPRMKILKRVGINGRAVLNGRH